MCAECGIRHQRHASRSDILRAPIWGDYAQHRDGGRDAVAWQVLLSNILAVRPCPLAVPNERTPAGGGALRPGYSGYDQSPMTESALNSAPVKSGSVPHGRKLGRRGLMAAGAAGAVGAAEALAACDLPGASRPSADVRKADPTELPTAEPTPEPSPTPLPPPVLAPGDSHFGVNEGSTRRRLPISSARAGRAG